jgi:acyl-CoA reductase-like NAD-dependent aldehyde dehydrogenase
VCYILAMSTAAPTFPAPGTVRPDDGRSLPPVAFATREEVGAAIARARAAQPAWAATPLAQRQAAMLALGRLILERRAEILEILNAETGRSPLECLVSEVIGTLDFARSANKVAAAALATEKVSLSMLDHPGKRAYIEALPHGVVGIIAPWNYPLINFYKHLFPALLAGNGVVMKPSESCPRTGAWLAARCADVLPKDLVQVVQGAGDVGAALLTEGIDSITFTGSVATGRKVSALAGERLVPCTAELGGKDAAIVLADCDLGRTVAGIVYWSIHNAGQNCASVERVYVEEAVADAFVQRCVAAVGKLRVAPQEGTADLGPLHTAPQLWLVEQHVADAVERGATVLAGGKRTGSGWGYAPTVLDHCTHDMRVIREETFGPILAIVRVKDADEAVQRANDSGYGLNGSVWTKDLARGEALARRLQVGVSLVNNHAIPAIMPEMPWTGVRGTGPGVANSRHAYPAYVRRRGVLVDSNRQADPWWFPADANLAAFAEAVVQRSIGSFVGALLTLLPLLGKRQKAIREFGGG